MSKRDRWIAHLTSSQHVHRFLTRVGGASNPSVAAAIEPDALRAYLESLRGGVDDAQLFLEVIELLTRGYDDFCESTLPKLITVLGSRTEHRQEIVGPGLRGVVRWDLTKVGRVNRTLPTARYVSNVQLRSYATPENLLLAWLLHEIVRAVAQIGRRVGTQRLHPILRRLRDACQAALRNEALSSVEAVRAVAPHMIQAASHSRHEGYRQAASLVQRRLHMQEKARSARWALALELLRTNWLEPVSEDDLFELFALSTTLSVLSGELGLGEPTHYGLLGSALEPAATYRSADAVVQVYFDRAPGRVLGGTSRYRHVIATYNGINASERRPDILIRVEHTDKRVHTFLLEVKNASSADYIRSSIYKLFGYLYDYESIFSADSVSRAALYLPDGSVAFAGTEEMVSGIVIIPENDRARLATALRRGLAF